MFSASHLRALALSAALFVPTMALSGCGGGGSGPTAPPQSTPAPGTTPTPGATATPGPTPTPINPGGGNQLLFDDFSASKLNPSVWGSYDQYQKLQRTLFGNNGINLNEGGVSFTRLTLDSYNPTPQLDGETVPGNYFRGTEITSKQSFMVGNGIEAEARLRAPGLPPGIVFAFFMINNRYVGAKIPANYRKDEMDFEFLTKQEQDFGNRNQIYTNVWNDWNVDLYGYDGDSSNNTTPDRNHDDLVYGPSVDANYDYANWNTYKIRWYPDHTEFYVNDRLERTEREVKPNQALSVDLNIWTPTPDFQQAFSGNLPGPVANPNNPDRKIYNFDVDYVRVKALASGAGAARVAVGAEAAQILPATAKSYRTLGR